MARRYWVKIGRTKYYGPTLADVEAYGQRMANTLRRAVNIGYDDAPRRRTMRPNPLALGGAGGTPEQWRAEERARRERLDYLAATKARRLAKSLRSRGGKVYAAEVARAKTAKFVMIARNAREAFTLYRPSKTAAEALGAQFRAAGYQVSIRAA